MCVSPRRLEYHLLSKEKLDTEGFRRGCAENLRDIIPASLAVTFYRWRQRAGGKEFHDRFILAEHAELWGGFEEDADAYEPVSPALEVAANGYVEQI